ncbi:SRPBCC family protein [Pontibacter roseus]|uniref:SRPBCC family protein n=1 Tax=Pontibacter roseus TaxID=336989 RepID=UPI000373AB37|nr:SRPBCC family protein [Pontibacter roseus]
MKALIILIVSLLVTVAAVYSGSFLLPVSSEVTKSVVVQAPAEKVFPYLNNPTQWEKWNAWNKTYDPTMIRLYGGPMTGKGAYQQWNGDKLGMVQMHFTESTPPSQLYYKQQVKGEPYETIGVFSLQPMADSTRVVWQQKTSLEDNPMAKYKGFFRKLQTENETEQSLSSLKSLFEAQSSTKAL